MCEAGYSPSVRLFEAAACGTPIISDSWPGLETIFDPQEEILVSRSPGQTLAYLRDMDEHHRLAVAHKARQRVLCNHTADHRAAEFERHVYSLLGIVKNDGRGTVETLGVASADEPVQFRLRRDPVTSGGLPSGAQSRTPKGLERLLGPGYRSGASRRLAKPMHGIGGLSTREALTIRRETVAPRRSLHAVLHAPDPARSRTIMPTARRFSSSCLRK